MSDAFASKISARKRRANRRNACKSTGPRTVKGKSNSRMNGLVHGLYVADCFMLPGENKSEFLGYREEFIRDLRPMNRVQLMFVDRIAQASWKLQRLDQLNQIMHEWQLFQYATKQAAELRLAEQQIDQTAVDERDADYSKWYEKYLSNRAIKICDEIVSEHEYFDDADSKRAKQRARGLIKTLSRLEDDERQSPALDAPELQLELLKSDGGAAQLERMSRQEQRLENSIHRNMRELHRLQKMDRERGDEILPPSPYLTPLAALTQHARQTADAYERELAEQEAQETDENVRTEATDKQADDKSNGKEALAAHEAPNSRDEMHQNERVSGEREGGAGFQRGMDDQAEESPTG